MKILTVIQRQADIAAEDLGKLHDLIEKLIEARPELQLRGQQVQLAAKRIKESTEWRVLTRAVATLIKEA